MRSLSKLSVIVYMVFAVTQSGCTPLNLTASMPWPGRDSKPAIPGRMSVVWTDTTLNQAGRAPVRGFGGRIMFYGKDEKSPVKVDGRLSVYAFDESETTDGNPAPRKKFLFTPEQLPQHYSESKLGHSYSVWIPWDEIGGPPRRISLIVRFEPVGGPAIVSDDSHQLLPGIGGEMPPTAIVARPNLAKQYAERLQETPANNGVTQASHEVATTATPANTSSLRSPTNSQAGFETVTINVPEEFAERNLTGWQDTVKRVNVHVPSGEIVANSAASMNENIVARSSADTTSGGSQTVASTNMGSPREASSTTDSAPVEQGEPGARFARRPLPVRKAPAPRPRLDRLRKQPFPASWPSSLPETPRSAQTGLWQTLPANAASTPAASQLVPAE